MVLHGVDLDSLPLVNAGMILLWPLITGNEKVKFHFPLLLRITFGHIITCFRAK